MEAAARGAKDILGGEIGEDGAEDLADLLSGGFGRALKGFLDALVGIGKSGMLVIVDVEMGRGGTVKGFDIAGVGLLESTQKLFGELAATRPFFVKDGLFFGGDDGGGLASSFFFELGVGGAGDE